MRKLKLEGILDGDNHINELYQCIEAIYRGSESNSSIVKLDFDMDLFYNENLPSTWHDAQFKGSWKDFTLDGHINNAQFIEGLKDFTLDGHINNNQSKHNFIMFGSHIIGQS